MYNTFTSFLVMTWILGGGGDFHEVVFKTDPICCHYIFQKISEKHQIKKIKVSSQNTFINNKFTTYFDYSCFWAWAYILEQIQRTVPHFIIKISVAAYCCKSLRLKCGKVLEFASGIYLLGKCNDTADILEWTQELYHIILLTL